MFDCCCGTLILRPRSIRRANCPAPNRQARATSRGRPGSLGSMGALKLLVGGNSLWPLTFGRRSHRSAGPAWARARMPRGPGQNALAFARPGPLNGRFWPPGSACAELSRSVNRGQRGQRAPGRTGEDSGRAGQKRQMRCKFFAGFHARLSVGNACHWAKSAKSFKFLPIGRRLAVRAIIFMRRSRHLLGGRPIGRRPDRRGE